MRLIPLFYLLICSQYFLGCKKVKENPTSVITAVVTPSASKGLLEATMVTLSVAISAGATDATVDEVTSGKIYYTMDGEEPTTSSEAFDLDIATRTSNNGVITISANKPLEITEDVTIKAFAVVEVIHEKKAKDTIGRVITKREVKTLTSATAKVDYSFVSGDVGPVEDGRTDDSSTITDTNTGVDTAPSESVFCATAVPAIENATYTSGFPYAAGANVGGAQSFKFSSTTYIKRITMAFYKRNGWTAPATVTIGIQADANDSPAGTYLTSSVVDTSTISSTSVQPYTGTLTDYFTATADTTYWLVLHCANCTSDQKFHMAVDRNAKYNDGHFLRKAARGSWISEGYDAYFQVDKCSN